ncbi:MAG: hypothetical protein R3D59_10735 [Paracoccaceae bacterium]
MLFYTVVRFYPTGNAILISFQDWNLLGARTWTGLDNYRSCSPTRCSGRCLRTPSSTSFSAPP